MDPKNEAPKAWAYTDFVADALLRVGEDSPEAIDQRKRAGESITMLDIREADEIERTGVLPGAVLLPRGLIEKLIHETIVDKTAPVVVYCATGNRSALAADVMKRMGYTSVTHLAGGLERWHARGFEIDGGKERAQHGKSPTLVDGAEHVDWAAVRAEFAIVGRTVPVLGGGANRPLVYLDHAASTHAPKCVLSALLAFHDQDYANVHRATYLLARRATERFEAAYRSLADFIGAELRDGAIVFTSNTTQAIDLASHVMASLPGDYLTTEMEHHSNDLPHRRRGNVWRARIMDDGMVDLQHMEDLLKRHRIKLVTVTAGANVTGLMPDIYGIARLAHAHGARILVDAAQALAHVAIDVRPPGHAEHIDFLAAAGHKAYAPFGAGFLYGTRSLMDDAPPYIPGGGTARLVRADRVEYFPAPDRHQGGTPNLGGVIAMVEAVALLRRVGLRNVRRHEMMLLERALSGLDRIGDVTVYGDRAVERRLGVIAFNVTGVSDLMTAAVLSEEGGLAVRNGRFCAHVYVDRLMALAHPKVDGPMGAVRASFGLYNTEGDVDRLLEFVERVKKRAWIGKYHMRGDDVAAEFAGRCADRWMEVVPGDAAEAVFGDESPKDYRFVAFHRDLPCRSYLIADPTTHVAAIIDPLRDKVDEYAEWLSREGYKLEFVFETHTHADHFAGAARLKERFGCQIVMHEKARVGCVNRRVKEGDTVEVGRIPVTILETPGHTTDSLCFLLSDRIFTGDTLLIGGCGRTDLPGGDPGQLYASLRRLIALPEHLWVFPAHDYQGRKASTIAHEKATNPRLQARDQADFERVMANLGLPLPERMDEVLAANIQC